MAKKAKGISARAWFYGQSFHSSTAAIERAQVGGSYMTAADECKATGIYVPVSAAKFLADAQIHISRNLGDHLSTRAYLEAFDILAHARAQVAE